ncbi:hypothetical protein CF336_g6866 [Tilletia laevis]|nr:hypothetical protein CF336_g6866 [Tilletia laevis]KAE8261383.1 hypothetical protein A4X03_0g3300 [Tilletia caries]
MELIFQLVEANVVSPTWLQRHGIVSTATYYRHRRRDRPNRNSPGRPRMLPRGAADFARELVLRRPDLYLAEVRDILFNVTGHLLSESTIHRYLDRGGISRKRAHKIAQEQCPIKRAEYELQIGQYHPSQLVFVDETSYDARTSVRVHARSQRNHNAPLRRPFNRGQRLSCIAGLTIDGGVAPWAVKGSFDEQRMLAYLEHELLPHMQPYPGRRSVLVMDNASIHKTDAVRELVVDQFGCKLEFLAPYSPDFNPIERAFANIKAALRRESSYRVDANAFFRAVGAIPAEYCRSWFQLAGYIR